MGEGSKIEWTDHTFNPWWGCMKVSPGCKNCYAETLCERFEQGKIWGPPETTTRRKLSDKYWLKPLNWNRKSEAAGRRDKVFCASMADAFEDHPDVVEERERLFDMIDKTPHLDWLLLTKRPENIRNMLPARWYGDKLPRNIWFGTSAEDQQRANERIPMLLSQIPNAAVHFVSYEPALEQIDLRGLPANIAPISDTDGLSDWFDSLSGEGLCPPGDGPEHPSGNVVTEDRFPTINWVIAGAESGAGARPMSEDWVRNMRDQCAATGVSFLYKQMVFSGKKISTPPLDGVKHVNFPEPR